MNIAFAADRHRIAQPRRHFGDNCANGAGVWLSLPAGKGMGRGDRTSPGAEILGGDIPSGNFPEIVIDVTGVDGGR